MGGVGGGSGSSSLPAGVWRRAVVLVRFAAASLKWRTVFLELHEGARATPPSVSAAARVEAVRACVREERREERDTAEAYMCPCFSECLMSDGVDVCECLASLFVSSHDYDCDRDYHPSF